jgi:putative ABC transport system ATP-binding protein
VAQHITHHYGQDTALRDVSLHIKKGEFVSFIGESGSGKSTLLSILSTLLMPTQGELHLCNQSRKEIKNIDAFRRQNIGFVFQFHYLIGYLSVAQNIALAMDHKEHKIIEHTLERLGIKEISSKYPHEISGGQRQRVAIARALANEPKIIFADEPTGNLDSKNSHKVFALLKEVTKKNTTVLVATHDTKLATCADTIYEVFDGKISSNR